MPVDLAECGLILKGDGVRHHLDAEAGVIWVVLVTRQYCNARGERLVVAGIETPDEGHRCRVSIPHAFAPRPGGGIDELFLAACRLAAKMPLVKVECDPRRSGLGLACELPVEDGGVTALQLLSMLDRLIEAAESWYPELANPPTGDTAKTLRRSA